MASRDMRKSRLLIPYSVGIYGPAALYKLAQWGALNKLDEEARSWNTISGLTVHRNEDVYPLISSLSSVDPTWHGQGQDSET